MPNRFVLFVCLCVMAVAGVAHAQVRMTFDGCLDSNGVQVPSMLDDTLARTFDTRIEGGRPVIRYNPDLLPDMAPKVRLFFYAHECARVNLGMAPDAPRMLADAREADCWGLVTLIRSGLLDDRDVPAMLPDMRFAIEDWSLLPGPPRGFEWYLPACLREYADRPSLVHPPSGQDDWNTCARGCADTLYQCQQRTCRGPACEPCVQTYEQCVTTCSARFPR